MRRSVAFVLLAGTASCADEPSRPSIVWAGEHLRFGTDEDITEVCAGTLPYADELVGYLGQAFEVDEPAVDYDWTPESTEEPCRQDLLGCTIGRTVHSREPFYQHELVHAVGPTSIMAPFEEGIAELFGDDWDPRNPVAGDVGELWSMNVGRDSIPSAWYPVAGHFASFLRARYGMAALSEFRRNSDHVSDWNHTQSLFADVFDESFDDAIASYADYPRCDQTWYRDDGFDCDRAVITLPDDDDPPLLLRLPMGCGDAGVLGPRHGERWRVVTFEVPVDAMHSYAVVKIGGKSPGRVRFRSCGRSCEAKANPQLGDFELMPVDAYSGTNILTCIPAGRFTARVAIDADDDGEILIAFERDGGPQGQPCPP